MIRAHAVLKNAAKFMDHTRKKFNGDSSYIVHEITGWFIVEYLKKNLWVMGKKFQ